MFSRWGAFVYRHRRIVLVLAIVVGIAASFGAGRAASVLSAGGWLDPDSESAAVADRLADEFGAGRGALIAVYRGADGADARGAAFQAAIAASRQGRPQGRLSLGTRPLHDEHRGHVRLVRHAVHRVEEEPDRDRKLLGDRPPPDEAIA